VLSGRWRGGCGGYGGGEGAESLDVQFTLDTSGVVPSEGKDKLV
jgi:hypothetical protein